MRAAVFCDTRPGRQQACCSYALDGLVGLGDQGRRFPALGFLRH